MVLITFTNIVVDDFSYGKQNPLKNYVYFLTHMHSDHYQGLTQNWNYGPIYCSKTTKRLLLYKFPQLKRVTALKIGEENQICLNEQNNIYVSVYLFDSNHCAGSVMFMFEGYFGRILHTGDMRFNIDMIEDNRILYNQNNKNPKMGRCSLQIDECIMDNTYCDPEFQFPDKEKAKQMITEIIDQHKENEYLRVLLCMDSIGKEELFVFLAEHYQTLIVVNEQRYQTILCMKNIPYQYFTTNRNQGWIEVIRKSEKKERIQNNPFAISITCTGWVNIQTYKTFDKINYLVPYSLHSNYQELELFVQSIRPSILNQVVRNKPKQQVHENMIGQMNSLFSLKQRGLAYFRKNFLDEKGISNKYQEIMSNQQKQKEINQLLGLEVSEKEKSVENSYSFQLKNQQIFCQKKRMNKGAKLSDPNSNKNFDKDEAIQVKLSIQQQKEEKAKIKEEKAKIKEEKARIQEEKADTQEQKIEKKINQIQTKLYFNIKTKKEPLLINSESDNEEKIQNSLLENQRKIIKLNNNDGKQIYQTQENDKKEEIEQKKDEKEKNRNNENISTQEVSQQSKKIQYILSKYFN